MLSMARQMPVNALLAMAASNIDETVIADVKRELSSL